MAIGAALSEQSTGEGIVHFSAMRIRVVGAGNLKLSIYSTDDVRSKTLVPVPMTATARLQPTRIINFVEQRAAIEAKTTEIDERFRVNRIVIFMKGIYKSYPYSS